MNDERVHESVFVRCPARLPFLPMLRQAVAELCVSDRREAEMYQVQLAVSELVTNIVTHAYSDGGSGTIEFTARCEEGRVLVDLYDTGQPFVAPTPQESRERDALTEGGYGLFIIAQTMDVVTHVREADDRNHWHMEKHFVGATPQGETTP